MNIFYLDPDPQICAEMHISKHVVKMIIEYSQLMSTAHRFLDGYEEIEKRYVHGSLPARYRNIKVWRLDDEREQSLMKASHINHPSAIWCRENKENYKWLYDMWVYLCDEYTYRYGKIHACARLKDALYHAPDNIPDGEFFAPTPAMPQDIKIVSENPIAGRKYDVLKSYHNYYNVEKRAFATWKGKINSRPTPEWYNV